MLTEISRFLPVTSVPVFGFTGVTFTVSSSSLFPPELLLSLLPELLLFPPDVLPELFVCFPPEPLFTVSVTELLSSDESELSELSEISELPDEADESVRELLP